MKRSKLARILCLIIGVVMLVSVFTACGGQKATDAEKTKAEETKKVEEKAPEAKAPEAKMEKVKYYGYYGGAEKETVDLAIANAQKKVPNIEVEIEPREGEKIKTYFATGDVPDMYEAWAAILDSAIEMKAVTVLDELITKSNIPNIYTADAMEKLKYKGHIYSLRNDGAAYVFQYYNKAIFAKYGVKAPESLDEYMEAIKVFKKNNIIPLALFAKEGWPGRQLYDSILTRKYPDGLNALIPVIGEPTTTIDDPRYLETAKTLYSMVKAGLLAEGAFSTPYDKAIELFFNGQAAMFENGIWDLSNISTKLGENAGILWYPFADKDTVANTKYNMSGGFEPGKGYALSPKAAESKAKADFFFAVGEELAKLKVIKRGELSTPLDLKKLPEVKYEKQLSQLQIDTMNHIAQAKTATSMSFVKGKTQVVEEAISGLMTGDVTPEAFIKKIKDGFAELK